MNLPGPPFITRAILLPTLLALHPALVSAAEDTPDFAREVLPILSDKCFVCHGPDAKKNQVKFTTYEEATTDHGGSLPINPADLANSEILKRIFDSEDPMPPTDAERQLNDAERDILKRWVKSGGEYAQHWAYVPPVKSTTKNDIDEFIVAKLDTKGVGLAESADKATLGRRVALVLTGLPPEPDVLAAYMADKSDGAYGRLVETLLASPRYGEHQARYWLDAVRYGDTHGLHLDNKRGIYPYRDWVIQALNENLPLDDFITWQIAGDLLPNPTLEQQVATGYVRLNPSTSEGGAIPAEFQAKNNFDRVETLGTAFLGMSLLCARCHTHKYDPVPHHEYYQLMAFFNSTAESAMDGNSYDYKPNVKAPKDIDDWKKWHELKEKVATVIGEAAATPAKIVIPLRFDTIKSTDDAPYETLEDQSLLFKDPGSPESSYVLDCATFVGSLEGFQLDVLPDDNLRQRGPGRAANGNLVLHQFKATLTTPDGEARVLAFRSATADFSQEGYPVADLIAEEPAKGWAIDPEIGKAHQVQLVLKQTVEVPAGSTLRIELVHKYPNHQLGRFKIAALDKVIDRSPQGQLAAFEDSFTTTLVAQEGEHRDTFVLERGEYNLPIGDPLEPGVVSVAGNLPEGAPRNRLGLAQWLTAPDHPLVARVLVNRLWQQTFGYGLVRTPEEFGLQGEQPTHPELLDWLAITLHETDWDLKAMLRRMVMSQTFRQSSRFREDVADPENRLFSRGPTFRLDAEVLRDLNLWASNLLDPHMGGEGVKPYQPDGMWFALAHPGSNTKKYVADEGPKLYRRSLYVYWKRTSPHPMMTLFDAPNRETSCVRRSRSNTPLQSLALFNETQRVETARVLAERLLKEEDTDAQRLDMLFRLIACEAPSTAETIACYGLLEDMRARYAAAPEDAGKLLAIGNMPRDASLDAVEHAAWTQVTTTILASDKALLLY